MTGSDKLFNWLDPEARARLMMLWHGQPHGRLHRLAVVTLHRNVEHTLLALVQFIELVDGQLPDPIQPLPMEEVLTDEYRARLRDRLHKQFGAYRDSPTENSLRVVVPLPAIDELVDPDASNWLVTAAKLMRALRDASPGTLVACWSRSQQTFYEPSRGPASDRHTQIGRGTTVPRPAPATP
jgi:hypothetical protein